MIQPFARAPAASPRSSCRGRTGATPGRAPRPVRTRKPPGVTVEHRPEDARRVEPRQAEPLDVAARRDEGGDLAVRQEGVLRDRRKRRHRRTRAPTLRATALDLGGAAPCAAVWHEPVAAPFRPSFTMLRPCTRLDARPPLRRRLILPARRGHRGDRLVVAACDSGSAQPPANGRHERLGGTSGQRRRCASSAPRRPASTRGPATSATAANGSGTGDDQRRRQQRRRRWDERGDDARHRGPDDCRDVHRADPTRRRHRLRQLQAERDHDGPAGSSRLQAKTALVPCGAETAIAAALKTTTSGWATCAGPERLTAQPAAGVDEDRAAAARARRPRASRSCR